MPELCLEQFTLKEPTRNQKKSCEICSDTFGLTTREHMCKTCFRSICDSCSPHKPKTYKSDLQHRLHRMCKICYVQYDALGKYIQNNKIAWGEDSDMSRLWLKQLGHRQGNYRTSVQDKRKDFFKTRKNYKTTIQELWGSLNYSFRMFIGLSIDNNKSFQTVSPEKKEKSKTQSLDLHTKILEQILDLLSDTMASINSHIEAESVLYILMFFMAHASESNALIFTKSIIQFLSLQEVSIQNVCYYLEKLQCSDIEIYKMENYLESYGEKIAHLATVNCFQVEVSLEVISSIMAKKQYQDIEKIVAFLLNKRKELVVKNTNEPNVIQNDLLLNTYGFLETYKKFQKTCEEEEFGDGNSTKKRAESNLNSDSTRSKRKDESYDKIIQENEELKIKNKNQEDEIMRLKTELQKLEFTENKIKSEYENNNKWAKVRKRSMMIQQKEKEKSNEDYDDNLLTDIMKFNKIENSDNISEKDELQLSDASGSGDFEGSAKRSMDKKLAQRMTTMSEKRNNKGINPSDAESPTKESIYKYQEIVFTQNEEIKELKGKLSVLKYNSELAEEEFSKAQTPQSQEQMEEHERVKKDLAKMEEVNKQLLLKLKQLSNLLMDKEEEMVNDSSNATLQELMEIYQEEAKQQECVTF